MLSSYVLLAVFATSFTLEEWAKNHAMLILVWWHQLLQQSTSNNPIIFIHKLGPFWPHPKLEIFIRCFSAHGACRGWVLGQWRLSLRQGAIYRLVLENPQNANGSNGKTLVVEICHKVSQQREYSVDYPLTLDRKKNLLMTSFFFLRPSLYNDSVPVAVSLKLRAANYFLN